MYKSFYMEVSNTEKTNIELMYRILSIRIANRAVLMRMKSKPEEEQVISTKAYITPFKAQQPQETEYEPPSEQQQEEQEPYITMQAKEMEPMDELIVDTRSPVDLQQPKTKPNFDIAHLLQQSKRLRQEMKSPKQALEMFNRMTSPKSPEATIYDNDELTHVPNLDHEEQERMLSPIRMRTKQSSQPQLMTSNTQIRNFLQTKGMK